ncbi:MAG: class I adenylate-forming enzyme family protein [Candidatus Freyarchaeota archaeon]
MSIEFNKHLTVGKQLVRAAWRYPDKEAVVCKGKRLTYRELNDRVNSLAHGLMELGIQKGDFVAVILMNRSEFVETYFALAKIGAIAAPQNYRLDRDSIEQLINQCEAKALIYESGFKELVDAMRPNLGSVKHYLVVGEEAEDAVPYERLATGYSTEEPEVEILQDDPQYLNYTSGTTGLPKASLMTHYHNIMVIIPVIMELGLDSSWVLLTVFPLFHRVGWATVLGGVITGCKNVITEIEPKEILEAIEKEKVNYVNLVPIITSLPMMAIDFEKYDLSSLRIIVYASALLTKEVREATYKHFTENIAEYYGSTDTALSTWCNPEMKRVKPTSLGTPTFGVELRIVDEEGRDLPVGEIGEIICRAPSFNPEYYKNPEKTKEVFRDGWFHMGDLGRFDEDKHLYVVGRVEDMIISGTDRIFAPEIEDLLTSHPKVQDCAVIGLPDENLGKIVTAVIVPQPGESVSEQEIIDFCRDKLEEFKVPKKVKITDSIPRTATGKILKYQLEERFSQER